MIDAGSPGIIRTNMNTIDHDAEEDRQQLDQPVHDEAREIHVIPLLRYGSPAALPLLGGKAADLLPHFVRQTSERRIRRVG